VSAVMVNEAKVFATTGGAAWWSEFRRHFALAGRIRTVTASLGGDLCEVTCDDEKHARWLVEHAVANGVPTSAVKVSR
jgi:hypothetical protein